MGTYLDYWAKWSEELERMAKKKDDTPADLFMQFKSLEVLTDVSDSETLVEAPFATGLSVRAPLLWLIHQVEFMIPIADWMSLPDEHALSVAVSTLQGLTAIPDLGAHGTIAKYETALSHGAGADEGFAIASPVKSAFLPPVPIASPNVSVYCRVAPDSAIIRGKKIEIRIGFTTAPVE
ncbi:unnamed protein product, partial [marine sediment metagenome]